MIRHKRGIDVHDRRFKDIADKSHSLWPLVTRKTYNDDTARLLEEVKRLHREYAEHVGKKRKARV